jgi:hypothetical protein
MADREKTSTADAVRSAVEQAFAATAGSTRGRAQELLDDLASAAGRVRDALDDRREPDEVRGLGAEVEALTARVAELERRLGVEPPSPPAASAGTKPAGTAPAAAADDAAPGRS